MVWQLIVAVLTAIGLLSVLWAALGWLIPACSHGWLVCPGRGDAFPLVGVFLWLRSLGIVRCPLIVVDMGLDSQERAYLSRQGIEICSLAELPDRLRIGENAIDGRDGDCPGGSQRCGIPEL